MIHEIELLDEDKLKFVNEKWKSLKWTDGSLSNPLFKGKKCESTGRSPNDPVFKMLQQYLYEDVTKPLCNRMYCDEFTPIFFSKFYTDCKYDWHFDLPKVSGIIAHHNVTVFLNDPDEYEGGELEIRTGVNTTSIHKPKAGTAVVYPYGSEHRVRIVTSGERRVGCFWLSSPVRSEFIRNYLVEMSDLANKIKQEYPDQDYTRVLNGLIFRLKNEYS